jgi:MFS family permease
MWLFFAFSVLARFLQGSGCALAQTAGNHIVIIILHAVYSILTSEFPENSDKYIGWMNAAMGLGLLSGSTLGSLLFHYKSYLFTFEVFGVLVLCGCIINVFSLPKTLNTSKIGSSSSDVPQIEFE